MKLSIGVTAAALLLSSAAAAQDDAAIIEAGHNLALEHCADCHVVSDIDGPPDIDGVPTFRAVAADPAVTASALKAFLATPHVEMPNLMLSDQESDDIVAYIMSLK
jgi:mono/diheme cytochrome c family protein